MQAIIHNGSSEVNPEPRFRNAATSARGFVVCKGLCVDGNTGNRGAYMFSPSPTTSSKRGRRGIRAGLADGHTLRSDKRRT